MNADIFWQASFAIQMHITLALAAVMVGALQLVLPKGTPMQKPEDQLMGLPAANSSSLQDSGTSPRINRHAE